MLRSIAAFVLITTWGSFASAVERPNIVLIVVDDLGAHDLGCYGSKFHRTPRLDMLAEEGVRFTQAYAACPVCSPTRAALMTGKAPPRTGITDWLPGRGDRPDQKLNRPSLRQQLAAEETTIAERLKAVGYATASIGKWHLGGAGSSPLEHGFDLNIAGDQTGTPLKYFAPFRGGKPGQEARFMPGLEVAPDGEYLTDRLGEEAAKFIAANAKRPFFLYLPHYGVHTPMQAPEKLTKSYDNEGRKPGTSQQNPIYAAMLESVDRAVGRVVDELDHQNLTDRTIVLFTSDNGGLSVIEGPNTPPTTNAPLREGKGYLYEGGLRVPLIARGAGIKRQARKCDVPVWSCDLPVTIAALAGAPPLDAAATAALDGVDISPLLHGEGSLDREALYWHYPHYSNQGGKPGAAVRAGAWKLIEFYENGRRELFDLAKDPREGRNLAVERPDVVEQLSAKLEAWRRATGALRPTPNPQYKPNPQATNGTITLPGKFAEVHGVQLRFEPAPHKNTLGYWTNPADFATWEFTVERPGRFDVEILQGCGKGQGGSVVDVTIADAAGKVQAGPVSLTVEDTGHFQNFAPRSAGTIALPEAGRYMLTLKPRTKKAAAVMDVREIVLRPIAEEANAEEAKAVDPARVQAIAAALREADVNVLGDAANELREAARTETRALLKATNRRETAAWHSLKTREDWERYRDERLTALRRSLGTLPAPGEKVEFEVTHRIDGDGFTIENLLFASRSGVVVAANLYRPSPARRNCPAIIICHSHHAPKTQGELQTMGMTWARQGAIVLVMDQLGHGERRTHRFFDAAAYAGSFKPDRQDYYFRYNTGAQLNLLGESLVGCIVGDLMRGVDLLTQLPETDAKRIVMLGAVAGGGDPVGVAAALDPRITVAAPFNFGGYEPEDVYPLPENAEETFDFAGSGSWESTRNLRLSARDGFQPWSIVASTAPRHLVYAHEFRWDEPRDPVWHRLQQVYRWYDVPERLSSVAGRGNVKGRPPEASHCTNIGAVHRSQLYPLLEKWIGLPPPEAEFTATRPREELWCVRDGRRLPPLHEALLQRADAATMQSANSGAATTLRDALAAQLGDVGPSADVRPTAVGETPSTAGFVVERVRLDRRRNDVEQPIPLVVVRPADAARGANGSPAKPTRIVVGLCQGGKQKFLQERSDAIAAVVANGAWVVLPDLHATGEMQPRDDGRGRTSGASSRSASLWMLGETALGRRVGDLRTVLAYLRGRAPGVRFSLWGESLVDANPSDADLAAPLDAEKLPTLAEPMGAHAALLAAMWEADVDRVYAAGGLVGYRSLLEGPYFYVPHDVLVPGVLQVGDVPQWVAALKKVQVRLVDLRDGLNRRYATAGGAAENDTPEQAAAWLVGKR